VQMFLSAAISHNLTWSLRCTRWYLPLLLLPLPSAPPFFLVLFVISLSLHSKPCFYCIVLLSALFLSSCYWPPSPLDSPLRAPWSDDITTYGDALLSLLPDLPLHLLPAAIPMEEHCWCDLTRNIFEPFNVTQWEVNSVMSMKRTLVAQIKEEGEESDDGVDSNHLLTSGSEDGQHWYADTHNQPSPWASVWERIWTSPRPQPSTHLFHPSPSFDNATNSTSPQIDAPPQAAVNHQPLPPSPPQTLSRLPLLRKEYDLRPYGFDLIIDFGWSRI